MADWPIVNIDRWLEEETTWNIGWLERKNDRLVLCTEKSLQCEGYSFTFVYLVIKERFLCNFIRILLFNWSIAVIINDSLNVSNISAGKLYYCYRYAQSIQNDNSAISMAVSIKYKTMPSKRYMYNRNPFTLTKFQQYCSGYNTIRILKGSKRPNYREQPLKSNCNHKEIEQCLQAASIPVWRGRTIDKRKKGTFPQQQGARPRGGICIERQRTARPAD